MKSKSEKVCRSLFQYFVQRPFYSCHPSFLGLLQLDGYCKPYELAFEYNGIQHYEFHTYFHKTKREFDKQLERDYRKNQLCQRYGILLITVPHHYTYKTIKPMSNYIYSELRRAEVQRKECYIKQSL
jgi:hypothetical protein